MAVRPGRRETSIYRSSLPLSEMAKEVGSAQTKGLRAPPSFKIPSVLWFWLSWLDVRNDTTRSVFLLGKCERGAGPRWGRAVG